MADITRKAHVIWYGNLKEGNGNITTDSNTLKSTPYSYATRFQNKVGTNPEELIAAAHAACYSMALANTLAGKGHQPERVESHATCHLTPQSGGHKITKMELIVRARVPDLDEEAFAEIVKEADQGCPVSNLLRPGLTIELDAKLE